VNGRVDDWEKILDLLIEWQELEAEGGPV